MKKVTVLAIAIIIAYGIVANSWAEELSLYDYAGEAIAYIDTDEDLTIFLWDGNPVAYVNKVSIYGFNGKHLGWIEKGIIRDHYGYCIGFIEGAVSMTTKLARVKGLRKLVPLKYLEQLEPIKPMYVNQWSNDSLKTFLTRGKR